MPTERTTIALDRNVSQGSKEPGIPEFKNKNSGLGYTAPLGAISLWLESMNWALFYVIIGSISVLCEDGCAALQGQGLRPYNSFASPGYPGLYPPNQDCVRVIQARPGYDIKISFKDYFQIETAYDVGRNVHDISSDCPNDFVEFRDGRYGFSPLIGRFCGMRLPNVIIIARSGFVWVRFRSDEQLQYRGFLATVEMVTNTDRHRLSVNDCHVEQSHALDGDIDIDKLSVSMPNNASIPIDCVYQLTVPPEYHIVLFIREFHLHFPNQCSRNFLEVYSGGTSDQPLRRFCGLTASTVFSAHNVLFIRFFLADSRILPFTHIIAMYSSYTRLKNCSSPDLFNCGDENCIPQSLKCNGKMNCPYGKDEMQCHIAQDTVMRLLSSSYSPLILLICMVFVVVCGLIAWSCKTRTFCRQRKTSYTEYLRDIVRDPPPGVNRLSLANGALNGNCNHRK